MITKIQTIIKTHVNFVIKMFKSTLFHWIIWRIEKKLVPLQSEKWKPPAPVAKLVDAPDLGSGVLRRVGSSPIRRTRGYVREIWHIFFFQFFAKKAWFSARLTVLLLFGTGFQPAVFAISYPETSSPVTKSIGFQPKPRRWEAPL